MLMLVWMLAQLAVPATDISPIERDCLRQLLNVRRVYVDRMSGGETAEQMRDMLISSLQNSRLFVLTENQDRADAMLRGSAEDLVFTEQHTSAEGINAHMNAGTGRNTKGTTGAYGGMGVGENESMHSVERRHEAAAAVRLVNKEGDVIWSAIEESTGGKFRGASAEVADKITGRLADDFNKARKLKSP